MSLFHTEKEDGLADHINKNVSIFGLNSSNLP